MSFSSKQSAVLRTRASGEQVTVSMNDALVAYVIFWFNTHFFLEQERIQGASIVVNYREISSGQLFHAHSF